MLHPGFPFWRVDSSDSAETDEGTHLTLQVQNSTGEKPPPVGSLAGGY